MNGKTGSKIKQLRERKGWTQLELSTKVGINNSVLSRIESNKRPVESQELKKFAEVFGISTDNLLGKVGDQIKESRMGYLSDDQVLEAAEIFSRLNKDEQDNLLDFMRRMAKKDK